MTMSKFLRHCAPRKFRPSWKLLRQDCSPIGRRDYAFLTLLATYGLRAGEIVTLRLEDIDWQKEILRVRHSKTDTVSELPLLREPGEAVLSYLEKLRPESERREVFLQVRAPIRHIKAGRSLSVSSALV